MQKRIQALNALSRSKVVLLLLVALAGSSSASPNMPLPVITTAMAVRNLPASEAGKEYRVRIRGVVTYVNPATGELFVQDGTAGIFVFIRHSTSSNPLESGQMVEVDGVTAPGDFSSSITKAKIKVFGQGNMPKPIRPSLDHLLTGAEDCQWGELKGVVRSGRATNNVLSLNLMSAAGASLVMIRNFPKDWEKRLIDARVKLNGVLAAAFNEHRQAVGVRMFVPDSRYVHIDDPAPPSPFDLPLSSAVTVGAFRTNPDAARRIRIRATATAILSKSLVYVSDQNGNLPVEIDKPGSINVGELLDIVGFPGPVEGRPALKNAIWRLIATGQDVEPQPIRAQDILPAENQSAGSGLIIAAGTRYDLNLVRLEGTLLQSGAGMHPKSITLASLDHIFIAMIPDTAQKVADELEIGSRLTLTGVCQINYDEYHRAQSFRLLIRRPSDIAIQSRPPWWTLKHALWIIGLMLLPAIGSTAWISVLRKQVASRTDELREANEQLCRLAGEDGLTRAVNRRRFDELLNSEITHARRCAAPVSLLMIDIDHFKALNDRCGHQFGDRCLIKVVEAIRDSARRNTDTVARYGGEEFAVILPNVDDEAAITLAEIIRVAVERIRFDKGNGAGIERVTVSVGVATLWPGSTRSAEDFISIADRALYCAKQAGRNRVVSWAALAGCTGEAAADRSLRGSHTLVV